METIIHSMVKEAIYAALGSWVHQQELGDQLPRWHAPFRAQARIHHPAGWHVRLLCQLEVETNQDQKEELSVAVIGSPDMVLESSQPDDSVERSSGAAHAVAKARIKEYWLVDNVEGEPVLSILKQTARGYVTLADDERWLTSEVLEAKVKLGTVVVAGMKRYRMQIAEA